MSPSDPPQDDPQGEPQVDPVLDALTTLGLRLVKACQHAHGEQGVSVKDLLWMLHGVMGQVLSWGFRR